MIIDHSFFAATPYNDTKPDRIVITISGEMPELSLAKGIELQWEEATGIHEVLSNSLPQGTMEKLLALMAKERAGHIIYSNEVISKMMKGDA